MEGNEVKALSGRNWVATMMLCWSLGSLGAHRFYTGKNTSAWAMLIMTFTGCLAPVSVVWSFFDGIMIALGKYESSYGELYERINWLGYLYIAMVVSSIAIGIFYIMAFEAATQAMPPLSH